MADIENVEGMIPFVRIREVDVMKEFIVSLNDRKLEIVIMKGDKVMKLHIGMTIEEAFDLFSIDDICVNDINGYYWVNGWYTLFSERIWVSLCFKDRKLWMINLYPHYKENENRAAYEIFSSDERICKEWVEKHKDQLPENTEAYYDHRTPEVGVAIR